MMLLLAPGREARFRDGDLVLLADQDRRLWDHGADRRWRAALDRRWLCNGAVHM